MMPHSPILTGAEGSSVPATGLITATALAWVDMLHAAPGCTQPQGSPIGLERQRETLFGVDVPGVVLPVQAGSNLATLVDLAIRDWQLRLRGVNAARRLDEQLRIHAGAGTEGSAEEGEIE